MVTLVVQVVSGVTVVATKVVAVRVVPAKLFATIAAAPESLLYPIALPVVWLKLMSTGRMSVIYIDMSTSRTLLSPSDAVMWPPFLFSMVLFAQ